MPKPTTFDSDAFEAELVRRKRVVEEEAAEYRRRVEAGELPGGASTGEAAFTISLDDYYALVERQQTAKRKPSRPVRRKTKGQAFKDWVEAEYPDGIPAGMSVKQLRRSCGTSIHESTARRALGLKK